MNRFLQWLLLEPGAKIVRVKSWRPWWGHHGIEWPTLLYDFRGRRINGTPVWDRNRVRGIFTRQPPEKT